MTEFPTNDIKGKKVVEQSGHEVGSIEDVIIEPDTWRVESIVIQVRDDVAEKLALKRRAFSKAHLRIGPDRVAALGDYMTLNLDVDQMRESLNPSDT